MIRCMYRDPDHEQSSTGDTCTATYRQPTPAIGRILIRDKSSETPRHAHRRFQSANIRLNEAERLRGRINKLEPRQYRLAANGRLLITVGDKVSRGGWFSRPVSRGNLKRGIERDSAGELIDERVF